MSDGGGRTDTAPLILLVEDDRDTRELYYEVLCNSGFRIAEAHNGHQALEKALTLLPQVVVTDLALPGLDGAELTARLKRDPRTCAIPVIAVTGHALESYVARAHRAGASCVLVKPCLPATLVTEINHALSGDLS
jgi:two-component system cell cycle response regulator DivK